MVTDRTQDAVDRLAELLARRPWTAAELEQFNEASDRGAYNFTDLNRVTAAMEYLAGLFTSDGYQVGYVRSIRLRGVRYGGRATRRMLA